MRQKQRKDMLYNNDYNRKLSISHSKNHKHNKNTSLQYQTTKSAIFTYYGKDTKEITRLLKKQK
jgi:hypothetical protein